MNRQIVFTLTLLLGIAPLAHAMDAERVHRKAMKFFDPLPATMPGAENDTPERIALGNKLYHDTRLSINDTQSCASCHRLEGNAAGVDNLATSPGAKGQLGTRNSPTVLNAGYQFAQFWDGRAANLVEQAKGPILNPIEMGMPDEQTVVNKLRGIAEYPPLFAKAFPGQDEALTYQNIAEAIASFERTLRTNDRFDDFLNGDLNALTEAEINGLNTFISANCTYCHDGPMLGGHIYERLGQDGAEYENQTDQGRFEVTGKDEDRMRFKVPTLRNIALTAPYLHDGKTATLKESVALMSKLQLRDALSEQEIDEIVTFLQALSDKKLAASRQ